MLINVLKFYVFPLTIESYIEMDLLGFVLFIFKILKIPIKIMIQEQRNQ